MVGQQLDKLIQTYNQAIEQWGTVRAVRLDFAYPTNLSGEDQAILDIPDILSAYQKLNDRLRKKVSFKRNWKIEYSADKGLHIHTVYYFDTEQVKGFNLKSNLYRYIKEAWSSITNEKGILSLVPGYEAPSENSFATDGKAHYSTLLSKDVRNLELMDKAYKYNLQKNKQDRPCGFIHWMSYLAKDEQSAQDYYSKCFG